MMMFADLSQTCTHTAQGQVHLLRLIVDVRVHAAAAAAQHHAEEDDRHRHRHRRQAKLWPLHFVGFTGTVIHVRSLQDAQ